LIEREELHRSELQRAVNELRAAHQSGEDQISALERAARQADEYRIPTTESACSFVELLCWNPEFKQRFIAYVSNDPHPRLGFQIRVVLASLRDTDASAYEEIGLRC
jgi:hypothetical protein